MRKLIKRLAITAAILSGVFVLGMALFIWGILYRPSISNADIATLIEIRDTCGDTIAQAHDLMLSHAPEGAWESTIMTGDYYFSGEEGRDSWDTEAYALIEEALSQTQVILAGVREGIHAGFFFQQDYYDGYWSMQLLTDISPNHEAVALIYCTSSLNLSSSWKPLDDEPYWFYYVIDRV